jgi:hypothetical protein
MMGRKDGPSQRAKDSPPISENRPHFTHFTENRPHFIPILMKEFPYRVKPVKYLLSFTYVDCLIIQ